MSVPPLERILVTGGTGFIGRYLVELLVSKGFRPLVTNNDPSFRRETFSDVDVVELDITAAAETDRLIRSYKPQIVIHLAGITGSNDPTGTACDAVNFKATVDLLKTVDRVGVERVIMIGTAAEYGDQPVPFREDMPVRPVSPYAVSKAKANQFALDMHAANGFPVTILRIFSAYGFGQPDKMFLSQLIRHALLKQRFTMSDGYQKRDFVHAGDVAAAIAAAMTAKKAIGRVINIGSGHGVMLRDLARTVWSMCGGGDELLDIGSRGKSGDDNFDTEADITLAGQVLDWQPERGNLVDAARSAALIGTIEKMRSDIGREKSS